MQSLSQVCNTSDLLGILRYVFMLNVVHNFLDLCDIEALGIENPLQFTSKYSGNKLVIIMICTEFLLFIFVPIENSFLIEKLENYDTSGNVLANFR
uniref:Uncharacterized protein n=1 Tax=Parascaris univalens TaxID=6257 RepID=A0A915A4V1_PARUN